MTRTSNGESSIHKDPEGRWHGYVSMGRKREGERDRRHVSGARRAEVARKVRALEEVRDAGVVMTTGKAPTLEQWLTHWLETISAPRLRPRTYEGYASNIRVHLVPHLGHHRLDRLQPEQLGEVLSRADRRRIVASQRLGEPPDPVSGHEGDLAARPGGPQRGDPGRAATGRAT